MARGKIYQKFDAICDMIRDSNRIAISGHVSPDQDSYASAVSLYIFLVETFHDKRVYVLLDEEDKVPNYIKELYEDFTEGVVYKNDYLKLESLIDSIDLYIGVDCGERKRIDPSFHSIFDHSLEAAFIDHHEVKEDSPTVACNTKVPSCSCLIHDFLVNLSPVYRMGLEKEIEGILYRAFYIGLIGDTGNFFNLNTTKRAIDLAAFYSKVMDREPCEVSQSVFYNLTKEDLSTLSFILENYKTGFNGRLVYIDARDLSDERLSENLRERVHPVDIFVRMEGCQLAFSVIDGDDGKYNVSLRSFGDLTVHNIARKFGGGGHKKAAGCTLKDERDFKRLIRLVGRKFEEEI